MIKSVEPYPKDHPGRPDSGRFKGMFVYASDNEPDGDSGWPVMVLRPKAPGEPATVVVRQKWYATPHEAYKAAQGALEKLHERGDTTWEVILG